MNWTVDAHCHWSDPRLFAQAETEIPRLIEQGVLAFQLGGVDPEDWQRQTELRRKFPGRIWLSFGLHPYFVAGQNVEAIESAMLKLHTQAPQADAVGETGLDFRKAFLTSGKQRQVDFFTRQLTLATELKKPVVLHIVRAHEEALHELCKISVSAMVHAFTGGPQVAKRYLDLGYHLSIGAKLLYPESHDLAETVQQMPLERLLIESDCPDQAPPGKAVHDSATVFSIAERVAVLKKLPLPQVLEQTRRNLFALIHKEIRP